jgi:3-hydroxyacyl-[acyl-carrier-protein] dehydratase
MLDRIDQMEVGGAARGRKAVSEAEDYFEHHFPGYAVVPGTILLEAMAMLAGHLAMYVYEKRHEQPCWAALAGVEDAAFGGFVRPGDVIELHAELLDIDESSATAECEARVDGRQQASATLDLRLRAFDPEKPLDRYNLERLRHDRRSLWAACDLP